MLRNAFIYSHEKVDYHIEHVKSEILCISFLFSKNGCTIRVLDQIEVQQQEIWSIPPERCECHNWSIAKPLRVFPTRHIFEYFSNALVYCCLVEEFHSIFLTPCNSTHPSCSLYSMIKKELHGSRSMIFVSGAHPMFLACNVYGVIMKGRSHLHFSYILRPNMDDTQHCKAQSLIEKRFCGISLVSSMVTWFSNSSMYTILNASLNTAKKFLPGSTYCCRYSSFKLRQARIRTPIFLTLEDSLEENIQCAEWRDLAGRPAKPYLPIHESGNVFSKRRGQSLKFEESLFPAGKAHSVRAGEHLTAHECRSSDGNRLRWLFLTEVIWTYQTIDVHKRTSCLTLAA